MDKICIKDLEIYAFHGVNEEEKAMGQKFLVSVEVFLCLRECGKEDNLSKTVNYSDLCKNIEKEFSQNKYNLIEKSAEELALYILLNYPLAEKVKVLIKKPWAPIGKHLDYVAVEIERSWHKVYIGLGSNVGDKKKYLNSALKMINEDETKVIKVSDFYQTKPVGYVDQEDFLNCTAEIKTVLPPAELMEYLIGIENVLKRERKIRWGPRTIDLDILLYDNEIISLEEVTIPHPRMHERFFVLEPLCQIAPFALHPLLNKRVWELKNNFNV